MKAYLMHREQDVDLQAELPPNAEALVADLELDAILQAMAGEDEFLLQLAKRAMLSSLTDPEAILYRQEIMRDCLEHPAVVREIFEIAAGSIEGERKIYEWKFKANPDTILHRAVEVLKLLVDMLRRLKVVADQHGSKFRSEGFVRLFQMLEAELDDDYFATIENHLTQLKFSEGILMSAALGDGNHGSEYVLHPPRSQKAGWKGRLNLKGQSAYMFTINDREEEELMALAELRARALNLVANACGVSADHILSFFTMLRREVGFYVAGLNLHEQLSAHAVPLCQPEPSGLVSGTQPGMVCAGLYDVSLALRLDQDLVGNDVRAGGKSLVMITGANRGGKSTFLRSIGQAQLMMQCGMFVGAESFTSTVCGSLFTHYKKEEDREMVSGKLDEELSRMNDIVEMITPHAMLLCNESFQSTNESDGSEIALQIVSAMVESGVRVFFVTHLVELARRCYDRELEVALFLRAEREADGRRTYRMIEGEPLSTGYGEDVYARVFGAAQGRERT